MISPWTEPHFPHSRHWPENAHFEASKNILLLFPNPAWPKNIDFGPSEIFFRYFSSPAWVKYSFCGFHAKFIWKFVSNGRWRGSFAAFPGPWLKNNGVLFFNLTIIVYCSYLINSFVSNPRWAKCRKPTVFWPLGFTVFFAFSFLNMFFAMCPRSWLRNVDSVSYFQFRLTFKFPGPGKHRILPCSQTCLIVIPYVCTFCPIKLDAKKVHGYVHTSSSPPCAGPSGLWFDM